MKNLTDRSRPAAAAADARDELRSLVPALDRAISENHPTITLVERVRDVAIRHAEALRLALKRERTRARGPFWKHI